MPLMNLVITLIVVGVLLWLVNRFIPMQSSIKSILNGVVVIAVVLCSWTSSASSTTLPRSTSVSNEQPSLSQTRARNSVYAHLITHCQIASRQASA